MDEPQPLATDDEIAAYLNVTKGQLAQMRYTGTGPRYTKVGRRIRYRWADVYEWVESHTRTRTWDES